VSRSEQLTSAQADGSLAEIGPPARVAAAGSFIPAALLVAMALGVCLYLPLDVASPFKAPGEFIVLALAWGVIGAVAAGRVAAGRSPLRLGDATRLTAQCLIAWLIASSLLALQPASAWRFGATAATYLLLGLSLADWIGAFPVRRRVVTGVVAGVGIFQVAIGALQAWKAPLTSWGRLAEALPAKPPKRWLYDFFNAVGAASADGRPVGTLGNVNYMGELLVLTVPLLLALAWRGGWLRRSLAVAVSGLAVGLLLVASARAALAGLGLALPVALWLATRDHPRHPRRWPKGRQAAAVASALGFSAVALTFAWPSIVRYVSHEPALLARLAHWQAMGPVWLAHPLQGIGLGGFQLLGVTSLQAAFPLGVPAAAVEQRLMQLHNEPFQILLELGLVGLGLAIALAVQWLRAVQRNGTLSPSLRFGLLWGVGAIALASGTGFPLHIPLTGLLLTLVLAIGLAGATPEEAPRTARRPWPAVAVLAALGLAGWLVIVHSAWPEYRAHRLDYAAAQYRQQQNWPRVELALAEAGHLARFKGRLRWFELQALVKQAKYEQAIALYASSADAGLGVDSEFWYARALEGLGRFEEARASYRRIRNYYPPDSTFSSLAGKGLERLAGSPPAAQAAPGGR
jgi:tetratricopeptide (TPR) repeat protein